MEEVLAVYMRSHDPERPLVCLDEASKQLILETRASRAMKPGRLARSDYEYERNGTANLFMMFAPLEGWRHVKVTDRRTSADYAHALKDWADIHFRHVKKIVLVQDNLNTIKRLRSMKPSRLPKHGGSLSVSNGTTRPNTAAGSIWRHPNSASYRPNAWIAAFPISIL